MWPTFLGRDYAQCFDMASNIFCGRPVPVHQTLKGRFRHLRLQDGVPWPPAPLWRGRSVLNYCMRWLIPICYAQFKEKHATRGMTDTKRAAQEAEANGVPNRDTPPKGPRPTAKGEDRIQRGGCIHEGPAPSRNGDMHEWPQRGQGEDGAAGMQQKSPRRSARWRMRCAGPRTRCAAGWPRGDRGL